MPRRERREREREKNKLFLQNDFRLVDVQDEVFLSPLQEINWKLNGNVSHFNCFSWIDSLFAFEMLKKRKRRRRKTNTRRSCLACLWMRAVLFVLRAVCFVPAVAGWRPDTEAQRIQVLCSLSYHNIWIVYIQLEKPEKKRCIAREKKKNRSERENPIIINETF